MEEPGRPGSPITGEQSDLDVARSAAMGLWSCSKSKRNKLVSNHEDGVWVWGAMTGVCASCRHC